MQVPTLVSPVPSSIIYFNSRNWGKTYRKYGTQTPHKTMNEWACNSPAVVLVACRFQILLWALLHSTEPEGHVNNQLIEYLHTCIWLVMLIVW